MRKNAIGAKVDLTNLLLSNRNINADKIMLIKSFVIKKLVADFISRIEKQKQLMLYYWQ